MDLDKSTCLVVPVACLLATSIAAAVQVSDTQPGRPGSETPRVSGIRLPENETHVTVPLLRVTTLVLAQVTINDHTGNFIIDTGANATVIDRRAAQKWRLPRSVEYQTPGP